MSQSPITTATALTTPRAEPMIYPLLAKFAAEGGELGCVPQLTASYRVVCPWTGPQFIKARMSEFVRTGCPPRFLGYATPSDRFYEFNVAAAAEWSWNAHGGVRASSRRPGRPTRARPIPRSSPNGPPPSARSAGTFTAAASPISGSPAGALRMFQQGKPPARLGPLHRLPTLQHFDADLAACDRAMSRAKQYRSPAMIEETRVIRGLVEMLKGLYLIADVTAIGQDADADQRKQAADAMLLTDRASQEVRSGLVAGAMRPRR